MGTSLTELYVFCPADHSTAMSGVAFSQFNFNSYVSSNLSYQLNSFEPWPTLFSLSRSWKVCKSYLSTACFNVSDNGPKKLDHDIPSFRNVHGVYNGHTVTSDCQKAESGNKSKRDEGRFVAARSTTDVNLSFYFFKCNVCHSVTPTFSLWHLPAGDNSVNLNPNQLSAYSASTEINDGLEEN